MGKKKFHTETINMTDNWKETILKMFTAATKLQDENERDRERGKRVDIKLCRSLSH